MATEGVENWEGWAIVELMGHRKLAGYIGPAPIAGGAMLRVDVYAGDTEKPTATQFYSPNAFYCITPAAEDICRRFGLNCVPQPVTRYELPALPAPPAVTLHADEAACPDCNCFPCTCTNEDDDDDD
jgi:hypothetical protein